MKKSVGEIEALSYPEYVGWIAYFKIKADEAKADHLERTKDAAMARQRGKPLRRS